MLTEKEKELIELIRNSDNPQMALYKAVGIISEFVTDIYVSHKIYPHAYLKG